MTFVIIKFSKSLDNFPFLTLKYPPQLYPLKHIQAPLLPQTLKVILNILQN